MLLLPLNEIKYQNITLRDIWLYLYIPFTNMAYTRPEDLRLIADLMKSWIPPHMTSDSMHQIKADRASLLPLLRVSKVSLIARWESDDSRSITSVLGHCTTTAL